MNILFLTQARAVVEGEVGPEGARKVELGRELLVVELVERRRRAARRVDERPQEPRGDGRAADPRAAVEVAVRRRRRPVSRKPGGVPKRRLLRCTLERAIRCEGR